MNFFTRFADTTETTSEWIQNAAIAFEVLAVLILVAGVLFGTARFLYYIIRHRAAFDDTYLYYKHRVARSLLLGLEILVAADVIRTVALEPTLDNIAALGLLVLVRTFLSWSLVVETENRWPWQTRPTERNEDSL